MTRLFYEFLPPSFEVHVYSLRGPYTSCFYTKKGAFRYAKMKFKQSRYVYKVKVFKKGTLMFELN